ncbi:MAG: mannose-6-phosphate isomerase, class I [Nitriliruptoraceae bacterium]|nr:mannose-6-phosphate isomerase, class I [Nitriliruptoraceae bacterium]
MTTPHLARLDGVVQHYAWGSRTALAELRGRPSPTDRPEAELWIGAHPRGPARLLDGPSPGALDAVIAAHPVGMLGEEVVRRLGPRLPLLLKVLGIDAPLSLQVHPSHEQAEAGFAREEAAGIAIDAPERNYRDRWPKPELLIAHTEVEALAGFRRAQDIVATLDAMAVPLLEPIRRQLASEGDGALRHVVARLLTWSPDQRGVLTDAIARRATALVGEGHPDTPLLRWLPRLRSRHHTDPGIAVALLLHHLHLAPGEALFLPAGNIHAYLRGTAIECMAASDNVLRGGLTSKHIDVPELLRILDPTPVDDVRVAPTPVAGGVAYLAPTPWFAVQVLRPHAASVVLDDAGPQLLLALGDVEVVGQDRHLPLSAGQAAFVPGGAASVRARGPGPLVRATVGSDA